ncbi:MAG TPA: IclR family transcriptional regulator [Trebonia sp.]|nr:IclR family transcriptional regulator [Trebonia sp.]
MTEATAAGAAGTAAAAGAAGAAGARAAEGGVQSVHRAIDVMEALAAAGGTASLSELASACGLPAPTLHRLAATLADRGYLRQSPDRRYSLGSRLIPLGADAHALLGARALPVLRDLAELAGESANLAVLTQGRAEYVAQAPGRHAMRIFTEVGNRVELHCTGVGKALLAVLSSAQATRLIGTAPLAARTPASITDPAALAAEIALIRDRGYALDEGEMEVGVRCVAVGMPGAVPMAVSVSGPAARMTDDLITTVVSGLRAATGQLRRQLA